MGTNAPDEKRTFGYRRFDILAAALNAVLLYFIAMCVRRSHEKVQKAAGNRVLEC